MDYLKSQVPELIASAFFDADSLAVAQKLLGKVLQVRQGPIWLMARIIETEAYCKKEKGSHASLGLTHSRRALFSKPGTIYMYYARGGDSLNFSCRGKGNAVLIKSGFPVAASPEDKRVITQMLKLNPTPQGDARKVEKLCSGQSLLCKALGLKVPDWNDQQLDPDHFRLIDDGYRPSRMIQTTRLGIHPDRDAHLPYRFIDHAYASFCTKNPLTVRNWQINRDYSILKP